MNKIYSVVWNSALGMWTVASELTRGKKKSNSRKTLAAMTAMTLLSMPHLASATITTTGTRNISADYSLIQPGTTDNVYNDRFLYSNDTLFGTLTISGALPTIEHGVAGVVDTTTIAELLDQDKITLTSTVNGVQTNITAADLDNYYYNSIGTLPSQNVQSSLIDPATVSSAPILVYDTTALNNYLTPTLIGSMVLDTYNATVSKIYNNFGIVEASNGATVNLNIGDDSKNARDVANTISLLAKNSSLLKSSGSLSAVNWISDNYISFGVAPVVPPEEFKGSQATSQFGTTLTVDTYGYDESGNAIQTGTKTFTITNTQELGAFNDWLLGQSADAVTNVDGEKVSQLQLKLDAEKGTASVQTVQDWYSGMIQQVLASNTTDAGTVDWDYKVWTDSLSHTNNATLANTELHAIYADGLLATGTLAAGSILAVDGSIDGAMKGQDGAVITNQGSLNVLRTSTGQALAIGMQAENAVATNTGTINSGLFIDKDGRQTVNSYGAVGMQGTGTSIITNNGAINQAITTNNYGAAAAANPWAETTTSSTPTTLAVGMQLSDKSSGVNNKTINVVDGNLGSASFGKGSAYGVQVSGAATFDNSANGTIYLGLKGSDTSQDVKMDGGSSLSAGIYAEGSGAVTNAGNITLGSLVRNAAGMLITGATGNVVNSGKISVTGNTSGLSNYGIQVRNSGANNNQKIENDGQIVVTGSNNIGIQALANSDNTKVTTSDTGSIDVTGTGGVANRNYALWVEGSGNNQAVADISSAITLNSVGDIGVHVRNNAIANIDAKGSPVFKNGDQIGYYLYGNGATANIGKTIIDDNGQTNTTIFRVAQGAQFLGNTQDPETGVTSDIQLTLNGEGSVGVLGTGSGTVVDTGEASFNVAGTGASAIIIEGGAIGTIDQQTAINLSGENSTAGTVDGQAHDIKGANLGSAVNTTLTSNATITSDAGDNSVIAYVAKNLGNLVLDTLAVVDLVSTDSIGVDVQQGGEFTNNSANVLHVSDGIGVRVSGANTQVNKVGKIQVDDGTAGIFLTNGAQLTVNGDGSGSDAITSNGTADGIRLDTGAKSLTAKNVTISALGSGAGIQNDANRSNITLNNVTINATDGPGIRTSVALNVKDGANNVLNVSGDGTGFAFETRDGGAVTGDLNIGTGYTVNVTGSDGSGIRANTDGKVTTAADINVNNAAGSSAIIAKNVSALSNTGKIISASTSAPVIDASGDSNKTITNTGTIQATNNTAVAIESGNGNDTIDISGGTTSGVINTGGGTDTFNWNSGTFAGEVNFAGTNSNNQANIGDVSLANTRHITTASGAGNALTFTNTHGDNAKIGTLASDDLTTGTNIGTGWGTLTITGPQADMRIVDSLQLASKNIAVNNGATLRSGDRGDPTSTAASIGNYNVTTQGANSKVIFDTTGDDTLAQIYSGVISGDGNFERATGGTTIFTANNTYSGSTTIDQGGTLQLGAGGTTGEVNPDSQIIDNGILKIFRSDKVLINGVISGIGALEQIGSGITRLTGNNTYKGATTVSNGTLLVNGDQSQATGSTIVSGTATLGGTGIVGGDVQMNGPSTLSAGDEGVGTLTINGNLQLGSNSTSAFELGQAYTPGGSLNDLINVRGDLLLDGTLDVMTSPNGTFGPGVYRIYNYGGTLTNNTLDLGDMPQSQDKSNIFVQTSIDKQVNLVNANGVTLQFWDGAAVGESHGASGIEGNNKIDGGDGKWMAIGDAGDDNWTTATGVGNAPWAQKSFAVFTATPGTVMVDAAAGAVTFSGAQFDADGYLIKGDALNAYATTEGATYAGQTPGTGELLLRVGAGAAGQDYSATIASVIREASTADKLTLVKTDLGRLILSGDNEYRGGTRIDGGTLQISSDSNLGQSGTGLAINNGSVLQLGADLSTDRTITLGASDSAEVFDLNSHHFTPGGDITGDGKLKITSSSSDAVSTLTLDRANSYQGETEIAGTSESNNVTVNASKTGAFGSNESSTVSVNNGATLNVNGIGTSLASLTMNIADSLLTLADNVTAASAKINLTGSAQAIFQQNATGGNATINVGEQSLLALTENASGGNAEVTNSGLMTFADQTMAENAVVTNLAGANVDISGVDSVTAIGSLSGAGDVELANKQLALGHLGRDDLISGIIGGDNGSLVKTGGGTLTLTGDNTYTGVTNVEQGVLLVNGDQSAATGLVTVNSGATLGGDGIIGGAVNVLDNGHITAGADLDSVGKLTTGALTLSDNAQLDYQFGQAYTPGGPLNDVIDVNGDLTLDGKLNIVTSPGGSFDVGVYRVINYSGALTNNIMDIGSAPEATDSLYVQTSVKNQVNLVNHAGLTLRFWDGAGGEDGVLKNNNVIDGGDGIWQSSRGNDNWTTDETTPEGALNAPFTDAAFAVFEGAAGNVTVDNSKGDVIISGAQFASDGYRVGGEAITTNTADTLIRVGDGTVDGASYIATIDSVIRGSGGINKSDLGTLILTGDNTYTGGTTITAGTLQVAGDNNLGAIDTGITFNGGTLKYGDAFNTARQVTLESAGGTFDTNGYDVALLTAVEGSGQLSKTGLGTLTLTQDNTYTGGTVIEQGVLQLGNGDKTGNVQGNIVDNGILDINRSNTLTINGDISGTGQLQQIGSGTTVLAGNNSYSGATLIASGVLQAGGNNTLSAASNHSVAAGATLDTQGYNQTVAGLTNSGNVSLTSQNAGSALTVKGNYSGENGTLKIAAKQNTSGVGTADRLVIDGGHASGSTLLDVDGSGLGAATVGNGIEVVTALNGATTTAQTSRDAFHLASTIMAAGAFDYQLYAGDAQGQGDNWYLRSQYRPEAMLFSGLPSVVRQGDISLLGNMHQRMGDDIKPGIDEDNRAWARMIGYSGKTKLDDAAGTKTDSHTMGIQVGTDLYANKNWKAGMYTSILDIDSNVTGSKTGSAGKGGDIDDNAFYVGGYTTWFSGNGMYVDNVLQYGRHNSRLSASGNTNSYTVNGNTLAASTEVGKAFQLGASAWSLEPQAQLIYQYSDFDDSTIDGVTKTKVDLKPGNSFTARLGVRLVGDYDTNHGKIQPYGRVNLWQGLGSKDKAHFTNAVTATTLDSSQQYSSTEVAAGMTWTVARDVQVYGELGTQFSNGGDKSRVSAPINASIGFKKMF